LEARSCRKRISSRLPEPFARRSTALQDRSTDYRAVHAVLAIPVHDSGMVNAAFSSDLPGLLRFSVTCLRAFMSTVGSFLIGDFAASIGL
jgi:hypothetical protein